MPNVRVNDINIYYEVHGEGHPIVFIRGLGSNADHWYAQIPVFSKRFRCISFDNRGIGRSEKPDYPYTISMMAKDTLGLMDALHIRKAHVVSISMGGMIAQVMAISYPERISGLVLACTHCGGERAVRPTEEVARAFFQYITTCSEEAAKKAFSSMFSRSTLQDHPEIVERYKEISRRFPPSPRFLIHQWEAVQGHDTWNELSRINAPTLVITGKDDILVPPENSRILAERIPYARLEVIEGGGHQFFLEKADIFNNTVLEFFDSIQ